MNGHHNGDQRRRKDNDEELHNRKVRTADRFRRRLYDKKPSVLRTA